MNVVRYTRVRETGTGSDIMTVFKDILEASKIKTNDKIAQICKRKHEFTVRRV